jgi:ATP-dependent DNA ligase
MFVSSLISYGQGEINITQDERIQKLTQKQIDKNKEDPKIDGYRVQIHFSNNQNRLASEKTRAQLSNDFPSLKTYLEFKAPYYKIQAGDFLTKLEAFNILKEISKKYVGAYIVKTDIYFEAILD